MDVWQLLTAIASAPSALVVVRGLLRRAEGSAKSTAREVDYLRSELVRERAECEEDRREYEKRIASQAKSYGKLAEEKADLEAQISELRQQIAKLEHALTQANAVISWMASQKGAGE